MSATEQASEAIVDATAVEDGETTDVGVALAVSPAAGAYIVGREPEEILATAARIAEPLKKLIEDANLSKALDRSKPDRKHVEIGGWQAAGAMLGALGGQPLHAETLWSKAIEGSDGRDWEACVEVKTPDGVVVGRAVAMCGCDERTWKNRDNYARRSMAETRAESRAFRRAIGWVVHLAGFSTTPLEEMPDGVTAAPVQEISEASDGDKRALKAALLDLATLEPVSGEPTQEARAAAARLGKAIVQHGGGKVLRPVAHAILEIAHHRNTLAAAQAHDHDLSADEPGVPS